MKQVLAVIAAIVIGSMLGAAGGWSLGLAGALLALWVAQQIRALARRVDSLERGLMEREVELVRWRERAAREGAPAASVSSPPGPAAATMPVAEVATPAPAPAAMPIARTSAPASGPAAATAKRTGADMPAPATLADRGMQSQADRRMGSQLPEAALPVPAAAAARSSGWASADPTVPEAGTAAPADPYEPRFVRAIRDWFTGGNTLVRVGVVVLFFGVAFLLRYVAERTELPIEYRLAGVALAAIAMLGLGWRLRVRRPGYALAIQGGAVAILYLTVFVALRLYGVLAPAAAFPLLVLITAFAIALAVLQDSQVFALLATAGGFAAPILASSGQGDHVMLFGYYLVLTGGIVGVAWFKAWRPVLLLGFVATFVVASAWGALRYRAALFGSTEPFLVAFLLAYVAVAVLFALRQPPDLKGYVDGTLVFGPPVAAFALQSAMLQDRPYRLAFSALAAGALYVGLAALLWRRRRGELRLLVESFLALGVAFLTLAIPLAIDGHWTAATWALEGAALVWVGCRQQRRLPRASGVLLQFASGLVFWRGLDLPSDSLPWLNSGWLGGALVATAAAFTATMLERARANLADWERPFAGLMFVWGLGWWSLAGLAEIDRLWPDGAATAGAVAFCAATAWGCSELRRRVAMPLAQWPAWWLGPVLALLALWQIGRFGHPAAAGGWWAWPLALALLFGLLRRHADAVPDSATATATAAVAGDGVAVHAADDAAAQAEPMLAAMLHALAAWLGVALVAVEAGWQVVRAVAGGGDWAAVASVLPPWLALVALPMLVRRVSWPFARHATSYLAFVGGGFAAWLAIWLLGTQLRAGGDAAPLPFLPLLNPLDLGCGLIVAALLRHWLVLRRLPRIAAAVDARWISGALAALGFVWLNGALLRAIHHLGGVPYELDALLRSTRTQVALSIFWALLALGTMLFATRRANRVAWIAGAGLLAVVVAKLFLVDLSRVGSIERIVSFVVVGLLMLVIGYFSPLPPARGTQGEGGRRTAGEAA